jgi:hypothetical protein
MKKLAHICIFGSMKFSILTLFILLGSALTAVVPKVISYQGQLSDNSGSPVDGTISITFSLYKDVSGGAAVWSEIQTISVSNGLLNVQLGSVEPLIATLFDNDPVYLGIKVGADPEMTPRQKITAGAFAQTADQVASPVPGEKIAVGAVRTQHAGRDSSVKSIFASVTGDGATFSEFPMSEDKDFIITDIYWTGDFKRWGNDERMWIGIYYDDGTLIKLFSGDYQPNVNQAGEVPLGTNFLSFKAGLLVPAGSTLKIKGGGSAVQKGIGATIAGFEVPIN